MIHETTIGGGIRLLVDETAATDVVAVGFWYHFGSRDETPGLRGATHALEHMVFKGTVQLSASDIARSIDRLGGGINAFTERECTAFHALVPREGFQAAVEVLAELLCAARFDPEDFNRERTVIKNELEAAEDDVEEWAAEAFLRHIWPDHPLSARIGGTVAEVQALDISSVHELYRNRFQGQPDLITISGALDIDLCARVVSQALLKASERAGIEWPRPTHFASHRSVPKQSLCLSPKFERRKNQYVQVFSAFPVLVSAPQELYYSLQIADIALGGSLSSRLFQSLRERLGLCYSVFSSVDAYSDATIWYTYATVAVEDQKRLILALNAELESFIDTIPSKLELDDAKAHLDGSMALASVDMEYRLRRMARQAFKGVPVQTVEESRKLVAAVSSHSVEQAIKLFCRKPIVWFAAGPARAESSFLAATASML